MHKDRKANPRRCAKKYVISILALICIIVCLLESLIMSIIYCAEYTVMIDAQNTLLRIVLLSDLHGKSFGRDNSRLIAKIGEQAPDAIFLDGDMIDRSADPTDVQELLRLIERLHEIAPVYFAPGNHELEYMQTDATLLTQVAEAGAVVVNDSYVT